MDRDGFVTGGHVDGGQCPRHGRDRLHRRPHPQRLTVGHPAFQTAGPIGRAHHAVGAGIHLVVGDAAAAACGLEAVADLHALDRLDAHDRAGQLAVEAVVTAGERAEPDGQPVDHHLDDSAERVAVLLGRLDLGDHRVLRRFVERAHRTLVDGRQIAELRRWPVIGFRGADRDDVRQHLDAECLPQQRTGDRACGNPGGRLAGAGPLQDGSCVVEAVFEHARVVGVAGPRPGQRRVAGALLAEHGCLDRVGGHDRFPLRPFGVADLDGDRAAERDAVADAGEHGDLVLLELHPGAAAVAQPAPGQLAGDVVGGDVDAGDHAFDNGHQGAAVGFTSCSPSQHASHFRTSRLGAPNQPMARPSRTRPISASASRCADFWSSARATIIAISQIAPNRKRRQRAGSPRRDPAGIGRAGYRELHHFQQRGFQAADALPADRRGRVQEDDALQPGVEALVEEGSAARAEGVPRILLPRVGGRQWRRHPFHLTAEHRLEQLPLALEVVIHRTLGHLGARSDGVE